MNIGIDLMGGDYAPRAELEGILLALRELDNDTQVFLFGNQEFAKRESKDFFEEVLSYSNVRFINCPDIVEMSESPIKALQNKPKSSLNLGFQYLAGNKIDVFSGVGNTGAMLVGAMYSVKTIEGIIRPTISSVLPKPNGKTGIILDVGINPDCRQDVLFQFGLLGSIYMKTVHQTENPKVALLNIGEEKEKGNLVTQAAYTLMENTKKFNFVGNLEGYDLFSDKADVVVCDGFTGNIVLKTAEGIFKLIKQRKLNDDYFNTYDYEQYGGTPILGVSKPVLVGHGISSPLAIKSMIMQSKIIVENDLINKIKSKLNN
jgi:phosphate acyltransferase